jgi:hypothetical protein
MAGAVLLAAAWKFSRGSDDAEEVETPAATQTTPRQTEAADEKKKIQRERMRELAKKRWAEKKAKPEPVAPAEVK